MSDDEKENAARREMRAAFQLTDDGLAAFLYGLVDQLLTGDTLAPKEGDTPQDAALKTRGRAYRDRAMKMLERLSGLDEHSRQILDGEPMWPSQNPLSDALVGAMVDGINIAGYVAPRAELDEAEGEALAQEIEALILANPDLMKVVEKFKELHPDDE